MVAFTKQQFRWSCKQGLTCSLLAPLYTTSMRALPRLCRSCIKQFQEASDVANRQHLSTLKQGVAAWNQWRKENPDVRPELHEAALAGMNLSQANLTSANLHETNLSGADLHEANLSGASLNDPNLNEAHLHKPDLGFSDLTFADLSKADLTSASLWKADLTAPKCP